VSKSKSKTYTISMMARDCGVSVASISKYVKRNGLKPVETGQNNAKLFSDADFQRIKSYYQSKRENEESVSQSPHVTNADLINHLEDTIDDLRKQLSEKDKQIDRQNTQIDALTQAVGNVSDLTKKVTSLTENAQQLQLAEKIDINESKPVKPVNTGQDSEDDEQKQHGAVWKWFHGKE
jgi:DNA-binding transcriptional MerR regulator